MKKVFEYKVLIGFIVLVLGVTYLNSLTIKELIKEERSNEIVMQNIN